MLSELRIKDFILIEDQTIELGDGLNAVSGESGTGKSVLLSALDFVLGGRAGAQVIRSGAEKAEVQAMIQLDDLDPRVLAALPDEVRDEAPQELLLSRSVTSAGKNRAYINGRLINVGQLEEVGAALVTLSSQREHLKLLNPAHHREALDQFAGNENVRESYAKAFHEWNELVKRLRDAEERRAFIEGRREDLETTIAELKGAKLEAGLREKLDQEVKRFGSAEQIRSLCAEMLERMNSGEGVLDQLRIMTVKGHELNKLDPRSISCIELLSSARVELQEVEGELREFLRGVVSDDAALARSRERLAEVARLERKYRTNDLGLCALLERTEQELALLDEPELIERMREDLAKKRSVVDSAATSLSESRKKASRSLVKGVEKELEELGLKDARLKLEIERIELSEHGQDAVQILWSASKDLEFGALKQIASGGEVARIFLAFQRVLGGQSGAPVLVFDEVDTGVSGRTARAVGEKLKEISKDCQVICVTHLPQVASFADHHFTVEKTSGKRTLTLIKEVTGEQKVDEIARMLSGYTLTESSRESARELLTSKVKSV